MQLVTCRVIRLRPVLDQFQILHSNRGESPMRWFIIWMKPEMTVSGPLMS